MEISDASLHLIAREGEGSMRDAQSLLDQTLSFSGSKVSDPDVVEVLGVVDRQILQEVAQGLEEADPGRLLQIVERVHNYGYDLKEFCGELTRLMRDRLVLKIFPRAEDRTGFLDLPDEEVTQLLPRAEKFSREELHTVFSDASRGARRDRPHLFPAAGFGDDPDEAGPEKTDSFDPGGPGKAPNHGNASFRRGAGFPSAEKGGRDFGKNRRRQRKKGRLPRRSRRNSEEAVSVEPAEVRRKSLPPVERNPGRRPRVRLRTLAGYGWNWSILPRKRNLPLPLSWNTPILWF